jgi:type IV secretory pathway VirB10-like protein
MADLSSKTRALVQASRSALRPKPSDRDRIEAALRVRLGPEALPAESGITQAVSATSWKVATGVAVGVCVIGAAAFWTLHPIPNPPAVQARIPPPIVETVPPDTSVSDSPAQLPPIAAPVTALVEPPPPAAAASSKAAAGAKDRLAREVALLSRATVELRAGHAAAALKLLREHQQKFPNGVLSEERRAAKVQALCGLGRVDEGRAELARLTPNSPAAAHAAQMCETAGSTRSSNP